MQVRTEQEAMFMACEMESTAVQLYTRALQVMDQMGRQGEELYQHLKDMLEDERCHLCRFRELYKGLDAADEQRLTLAAISEGILFEGGLMGAARQGLLKDVESMISLAAQAERDSVRKYREFAQHAQSEEAKQALLMIAEEEDMHLQELEATKASLA